MIKYKYPPELPTNCKPVLAYINPLGKKLIPIIANYSRGNDIEIDDEDGDYEEEEHFLGIGWFECCEQRGGSYDNIYFKRDTVVCWEEIEYPPIFLTTATNN